VRLQDIAHATGFSVNTVSLALRGSPRTGEDTRRIIEAEAGRLNYFPNRIAQSLVGAASRTVGLIMTDIMNPTLTLAARTIEERLSAARYGMMFAASNLDPERERQALRRFQSYQVDGVLLYPADHAEMEHLDRAAEGGLPVILLAQVETAALDVVTVDDRIGAWKAVSHLIARGHRRIVMVDGGGLHNCAKLDGARCAVRDAGLGSDALLVQRPEGNSASKGFAAMEQAKRLAPDLTAVFASTDALAIGVLRWCGAEGLAVPGDLAVIGYDDTEAGAFAAQPLTTVHYAADIVASLAVDRLIEVIDRAPDRPAPMSRLIEPELICRETT
jgi:LacI family transcriptional regulator